MCFLIQVQYQLCGHSGDLHRYPCSTPLDHPYHINIREFIGSAQLSDFPDFCPNCFLKNIKLWGLTHPGRFMVDSSSRFLNYRSLGPTHANLASKMWDRVEFDQFNRIHDEDIDSFLTEIDPEGVSWRVNSYIEMIWSMMACSFWIDVIDFQKSPAAWRSRFLIQLQNYQIANLINTKVREFFLPETVRSTALTELLKPVTRPLKEDELLCIICQDALAIPNSEGITEAPIKTVCNHLFGKSCLEYWLQNNSETCPLCRKTLVSWKELETEYKEKQKAARELKLPPKWVASLLVLDPDHVPRDWDVVRTRGYDFFLKSWEPTWETSSDEEDEEDRKATTNMTQLLPPFGESSLDGELVRVAKVDDDDEWVDVSSESDLIDDDD